MKKAFLLLGVLVAGLCLWLAFRGISFQELLEGLRVADGKWIAAAMGIYTLGYLLRAIRWSLLMRPIKRLSPAQLFTPMMLGFFANNVLPFRMGEFARAYIGGHKFGVSVSATFGTILLERICDTLAFLTTFLISALFFPFPSLIETGAATLGVLCLLAIGVLFFISHHQVRFQAMVDRLPFLPMGIKGTIRRIITNFTLGVSSMKSLRFALGALGLSLIVWTLEGTVLYLFGRSFNLPMSYPAAFFLLLFLGLSVTLPQAPGYVGTVELFGVSALSQLGIPKSQGLPVILAIHGSQFIYICLVGLWALWYEGLSLRGILSVEEKAEAELE